MTDTRPTIGFVGLGLMGTGFTRRLVSRGYHVWGYDIAPDRVAAVARHGVAQAASPADLARRTDIVLVCVTSTHAVEDVVLAADGVASIGPAPGKVLVDHSTTEIGATRHLASELESRTGMRWVDAPVSGGPQAAEAGTLAIMAGGAPEAVERVRPVLAELAGTFTHMGPVGAGQATKMVNQVLVLSNYCVIAEAARLAERCGIDPARIPEALAGGHADGNLLRTLIPRMAARDFEPRGFARQILKDLEMVHDLAREQKTATPMATQALTLFRLLCMRGHAELDGAAILKLYLDEPV
jgi:3-hydroxyisobutyrate dehydrogenase-like beta-hydroxyacid dehydrogenase